MSEPQINPREIEPEHDALFRSASLRGSFGDDGPPPGVEPGRYAPNTLILRIGIFDYWFMWDGEAWRYDGWGADMSPEVDQ